MENPAIVFTNNDQSFIGEDICGSGNVTAYIGKDKQGETLFNLIFNVCSKLSEEKQNAFLDKVAAQLENL